MELPKAQKVGSAAGVLQLAHPELDHGWACAARRLDCPRTIPRRKCAEELWRRAEAWNGHQRPFRRLPANLAATRDAKSATYQLSPLAAVIAAVLNGLPYVEPLTGIAA